MEILLGLILRVGSLAVLLPVRAYGSAKTIAPLVGLLSPFYLIGGFYLADGLRRLRRAVRSPALSAQQVQALQPSERATSSIAQLPPPFSVTEGTTQLIEREEKQPATIKAKDTDAMES